jgi:multidrug efflux pump subunit AcrB
VRSLQVFGAEGRIVPLMQVADVSLVPGYARIEREDLVPTVTVQARSEVMAAEDMVPLIEDRLDALRAELPPGHSIELDGIVAQSAEGRAALLTNMPLCVAVIAVILIAQFNSLRRPLVILATIPLVVIGAGLGLRLFGAPMGFMPILGLLSLAGIILNNAIVLIDRIEIERAEGFAGDEAVTRAATRRLRPILMTTVTTILGLLPLILSADPLFYGMAVVMAAGLAVGTVLTLGFVPVLHALLLPGEPASMTDTEAPTIPAPAE